ncbi:MAG: Rpn family recombination-promoting nuclease/putative transposase [Bryobacterales bacterium]|nr:Rpn family recombination-promoting nuclease/putative transposase [Bryobacterales bacterium]
MSGLPLDAPQPIDHDRFFKELLRTFFFEFLELFFPRLAGLLDRESVEFLNQELYVDLMDGEEYRADLLAKVRMTNAMPDAFFLVHVEHQSTAPSHFPRRFFRYFAAIMERHNVLVYPIVIYSHDSPRKRQPCVYGMDAPDGRRLLRFHYQTVQLNRLPWRRFLNAHNPVASALMSKMKIAPRDRPRVKLECLRLLVTLNLDRARMRLIASFVDAYLRLNEAEERRFRESRALAKLDPAKREAVMEYVTSWEERGMRQGFLKGMEEGIEKGLEKGIEQGMEAGRLETLREVLLDVLATRFGPLQPTLSERVQKIESSDELRRLTHAALTAASLQDLSL